MPIKSGSGQVDCLHQITAGFFGEATSEISCSGWIGNPVRTKSVEKGFIVSLLFNILMTHTAKRGVIGDIQNVIAFMVWLMTIEKFYLFIEMIDQAEALYN